MRWAQIKGGQRLHLALEPGEELPDGTVIRAGYISRPLCNRKWDGQYRMTINVPLGSACKNCCRIARSRP